MEGKEMVKSSPSEELTMSLPRDTEKALDPHVAQWAVRAITRIFATYAIIVGIAIVAGGAPRFAGVSYAVALSLPGAPTTWGVVIAVAGTLTLAGTVVGRPRVVGLGMLFSGLWSLLFASAFAVAAVRFPNANTTAIWIYLALAAVLFVLASVHLSMWKAR